MSVWPHSLTCTPDCPGHVKRARRLVVVEVDEDGIFGPEVVNLPPSIVVDGRVVELEKAVAFVASEAMSDRITKWLIAGAREVAE